MQRFVGFFVFFMCLGLSLAAAHGDNSTVVPARIETLVLVTDRGEFTFQTEIADTPALRERGLMFRHRLPEDRGMLFTWQRLHPVRMWMRNTHISLDMIFIGPDGKVDQIETDTRPYSLDIIAGKKPSAAILEVVAGTAKRVGLKVGDQIRHPMFGTSK